jgi:hypothetical protein
MSDPVAEIRMHLSESCSMNDKATHTAAMAALESLTEENERLTSAADVLRRCRMDNGDYHYCHSELAEILLGESLDDRPGEIDE